MSQDPAALQAAPGYIRALYANATQVAVSLGPPGSPGGGIPGASWSSGLTRGMDGFDGCAAPGLAGEVPDFIGTVRGYRWWTLAAPPLHLSPAGAEETWPQPTLLRGQVAPWQPGANIAECRPYAGGAPAHDPVLIPEIRCGCGFWGYWRLQPHELRNTGLPVCGVIEGYGAVLLGTKGFRAAKARIIALHCPVTIGGADPAHWADASLDRGHPRQYGRHNPWWNHPQFTGKVIQYGSAYSSTSANAPPVPPGPSEAELREEADRAQAWLAVTGDRLERTYPGARVFETLAAMLAVFPPQVPDEARE